MNDQTQRTREIGGRIYPVDIKKPSSIASWDGWPDDVRDRLVQWNRSRGGHRLSFRSPGAGSIFKCTRCSEFCAMHPNGTALLDGTPTCDDCLIDLARKDAGSSPEVQSPPAVAVVTTGSRSSRSNRPAPKRITIDLVGLLSERGFRPHMNGWVDEHGVRLSTSETLIRCVGFNSDQLLRHADLSDGNHESSGDLWQATVICDHLLSTGQSCLQCDALKAP